MDCQPALQNVGVQRLAIGCYGFTLDTQPCSILDFSNVQFKNLEITTPKLTNILLK